MEGKKDVINVSKARNDKKGWGMVRNNKRPETESKYRNDGWIEQVRSIKNKGEKVSKKEE